MRLTFLILVVGVFTAGTLFAQKDYSYLDNEKGTSMEPILARAEPLVKKIEGEGFEIVRMEYDLIFDTKSTTRNLYKDWTYGIVAFGDYRIKDIDLTVSKESRGRWEEIEKDAENDDEATITIKPSQDGQYKIEIDVYKFNEGYSVGHYGLLIFHE